MAHILVVLGALLLSVSVLQWGKLFLLDELPEFNRSVLEVMRQPLEDRIISISRAKYSTEYPASFMLVASMNPCPCGYYGHPKKKCVCNEYQRTHYMSKISGPLLDRIDLQIEVQPVDFDQMSSKAPGESSAAIRHRVIAARMLQERRFKDEPGIYCNAQMTPSLLHKYAEPNAAGLEKLRDAMERMNMSARAYDRILKVARTIADLDGTADVLDHHIMEAIAYRNLDRPTYMGSSLKFSSYIRSLIYYASTMSTRIFYETSIGSIHRHSKRCIIHALQSFERLCTK